jgi:ribose transport system ATP-binding protein
LTATSEGLSAGPSATMRLEARNISKTFGRHRALRNVSFRLKAGEIHALCGENGSGKSTLIKIISGYYSPDPGGELLIDGRSTHLPTNPNELRRLGVAVVHQDLGLLDRFSVLENVRVGEFGARRFTRMIHWHAERERVRQVLTELGFDIDPDAMVGELSAADRATVAIARALQHHDPQGGVLIFDESSRALPKESLEHFHRLVRSAADRGTAVVLISHQLNEVIEQSDRVTILRDGIIIGDGAPTKDFTEPKLVKLMLGYELKRSARNRKAVGLKPTQRPVLRAEGIRGQILRGVDFCVWSGEILGITGLVGSGFEELPYLIAGSHRAKAGRLYLDGVEVDLARATCNDLLRAGVALVPERRERDGLAMTLSLEENLALPRLKLHGSKVYVGRAWQRQDAEWLVREFGVRLPNPQLPVSHLSGGNQQKVLLGKWMRGDPKLLLLHEPTQGVDVGARRDIFLMLEKAAAGRCAVVLVAKDPNDILSVCSRLLVIRNGDISDELNGDLTFDRIVEAIYGVAPKEHPVEVPRRHPPKAGRASTDLDQLARKGCVL